jgi:hypothetical protein
MLLKDLSLSAPNFKKTFILAIKQGGIVETAINSINKTIDSIINHSLFFITKWSP